MKRGEIYYITYAQTVGSEQHSGRPGVIISNDVSNATSRTVNVVYLTTQQKQDIPAHTRTKGTGRESTVLCEQVATVDKCRVGNYVGAVSPPELRRIEQCLAEQFGIAHESSAKLEGERNAYRAMCFQLLKGGRT